MSQILGPAGNDEAGLTVDHEVLDSAVLGGDDRQSCRHRLPDDQALRLGRRGERENMRDVIRGDSVHALKVAREHDTASE